MGKAAPTENLADDAPKKRVHRKKREKLVKKQKFKKNKKKFKLLRAELRQIKRDKDELRKLGHINKEFAERVQSDKIYEICKTVRKLLKHDSEAEQALIELYTMLDEGTIVNLKKLEDTYVQAKLHQLFTLMKLAHGKAGSKDLLKFQKRKTDLHNFSFVKMIKFIIARQKEKMKDEKDDSDSDKNSSQDSDDEGSDAESVEL